MAKLRSTPAETKSSSAAKGATPAMITMTAPDTMVDVRSTPSSSVADSAFGSRPSLARTKSRRGWTLLFFLGGEEGAVVILTHDRVG